MIIGYIYVYIWSDIPFILDMEIWIIRKIAMCLRIPDSSYFRMNINIYKVICIYIYIYIIYMRDHAWYVSIWMMACWKHSFQLVFHAISSYETLTGGTQNEWIQYLRGDHPNASLGWFIPSMVKLDRLGHGLRHWPSVYQPYPTMQFLRTHLAHTCSILYHNHCLETHGIHFTAYARHLFDKGTFSIHLLIQSKPFNQAMSRSFHIPWW